MAANDAQQPNVIIMVSSRNLKKDVRQKTSKVIIHETSFAKILLETDSLWSKPKKGSLV